MSSSRNWESVAHLHSPGRRSGMTARTLVWAAGRSWRWCTSSEERFLASARRVGSSAQMGITTTTEDIRTWTRTSRTCVSGVRRSNRKQITRMSLQYSTSSSGVNFREEFGVTSLVLFGPTAERDEDEDEDEDIISPKQQAQVVDVALMSAHSLIVTHEWQTKSTSLQLLREVTDFPTSAAIWSVTRLRAAQWLSSLLKPPECMWKDFISATQMRKLLLHSFSVEALKAAMLWLTALRSLLANIQSNCWL